ncbi:MAG: helix-hairpin-helix domain-containing protein, partial [Eubacteriaceae bacterium]|nr:helix-hairpin-helix domain-containing protein [Eubacteriaceae bacterium]
MQQILEKIALEMSIAPAIAENAAKLIEEGNSIVFISRYRKEMTGDMDDQQLRAFEERLNYLKSLEERKEEVIAAIEGQGKLTGELAAKIRASSLLKEVEDLYLPYRPKRRTRATMAKERGLEPLAKAIAEQTLLTSELETFAAQFVDSDKGVGDLKAALLGACDIVAEDISENAEYRKTIRNITLRNATIRTVRSKDALDESEEFAMYDSFSESLISMPGHRVLAINRGEKRKALKVSLDSPAEQVVAYLNGRILKENASVYLRGAVEDAYKRLIMPSIETEMRSSLTEAAQEGAIRVFSRNLRSLLMIPPVRGKTILGFDPGFRNGCKMAAIDSFGKILGYGVVHLEKRSAHDELVKFIEEHKIDVIAIGNGTASREAEELVADAIKSLHRTVQYVIVNEAGASVYSASKLAAEEYPGYDVLERGAISIAQRLRDPLAELVKIDPKSIGVGQYQHDVNQAMLAKALGNVVEEAVNSVGVDINTASPALLGYVAGITKKTAANIFEYVKEYGGVKSRSEIKKISGIGEKSFEQCAGFLRVPESSNILD